MLVVLQNSLDPFTNQVAELIIQWRPKEVIGNRCDILKASIVKSRKETKMGQGHSWRAQYTSTDIPLLLLRKLLLPTIPNIRRRSFFSMCTRKNTGSGADCSETQLTDLKQWLESHAAYLGRKKHWYRIYLLESPTEAEI